MNGYVVLISIKQKCRKVLLFVLIVSVLATFTWDKRLSKSVDLLTSEKILPVIYCIMPTYNRPEQKAELTKQCNTFRLVQNIIWVVVEDSVDKTDLVINLLKSCPVQSVHLSTKDKQITDHKGVAQRNLGLFWIRTDLQLHKEKSTSGVIYFADDDNVYDPRIFEEMRYTRLVSVWPVGLSGTLLVEFAIVKDDKVVTFYTAYPRQFSVDMAGFAFSTRYLRLDIDTDNNFPRFSYDTLRGCLETDFIASLNVTIQDLEPRANNCSQVLVWHTKAAKKQFVDEDRLLPWFKKYNFTRPR